MGALRRVTVSHYEDEGPEQIMVYGTDDRGANVCFRVTGSHVKHMRKTIDDKDKQVIVELPASDLMN